MANKPWDEDREKLRLLLKELRKDAGLTQVELSDALGKPQSYVSKYETGERNLDYIEINDICKVLDISMEKFNRLYEKKSLGWWHITTMLSGAEHFLRSIRWR